MAESQAPYPYQNEGDQIELCLSSPRFRPYLIHAGFNRQYAFNLYLYNARLSKSFLYPLHILEISLRNRMNAVFTNQFGKDWPIDASFTSNLTPESLTSLTTAIGRAKTQTTDSIVSTLNFDFWSNLLRDEYHNCFWQSNLAILTPSWNIKITTLRKRSRDLNFFRNRIAHHEPIYQSDLIKTHKDLLEMIGWLCKDTSDWVNHYSTVNEVMRTSPDPLNELKPHYIERADKNFIEVQDNMKLDLSIIFNFIICLDSETKDVISIIDKKNIADFLLNLVDSSGCIMEDLNEHTYKEIIEKQKIRNNFNLVGSNESFHKAYNLFKGFKVAHLLVLNSDGVKCGVISKSHRRY
ncbi:Abi family protein [Yersinia enterocolitica]